MRYPVCARVSVRHILSRFIVVCLTAALLVGGAFSALPAPAVLAAGTCTSVADGGWASASTWDCGYVPTSADDVVVDHGITIDASQSVNNVTISLFGVLTVSSPVTLTISGNFDVLGIFDDHESGSAVVLAGTAQTILTHGDWVDFQNLSKIAAGPGESLSVDPAVSSVGGVHVLDTLTLQATDPNYLLLRSTSPGTQWQIYPYDTADVDWVDVQDANNVSDNAIGVIHGVDSGDNTGWTISGLLGSSVVLESSMNPTLEGHAVTLTATLSPLAATGTVAFQDGGVDIAGCEAQAVASGVATCTTGDLAVGSHSITAVYSGDLTYSSSASLVLTQEVGAVESTVLLPIILKP